MNKGKINIGRVNYNSKYEQPIIQDVVYEKGVYNIYKKTRIYGRWQLPEKQTIFNSDFDDFGVVFKTEKSCYMNTFRYDNTDNIYYVELK